MVPKRLPPCDAVVAVFDDPKSPPGFDVPKSEPDNEACDELLLLEDPLSSSYVSVVGLRSERCILTKGWQSQCLY